MSELYAGCGAGTGRTGAPSPLARPSFRPSSAPPGTVPGARTRPRPGRSVTEPCRGHAPIENALVNKNMLWQLGLFVLILVALNALFALHISILGSVALTVLITVVFNAFRAR